MSSSQLNKLNSAIKRGTQVTSDLSSNLIRKSSDETNFPHKLLLIDTQVSKMRKTFLNFSSANIKFSTIQLSKIVQLKGFLLSPLNTFGSTIKEIVSSPENWIKNSFWKKKKE